MKKTSTNISNKIHNIKKLKGNLQPYRQVSRLLKDDSCQVQYSTGTHTESKNEIVSFNKMYRSPNVSWKQKSISI